MISIKKQIVRQLAFLSSMFLLCSSLCWANQNSDFVRTSSSVNPRTRKDHLSLDQIKSLVSGFETDLVDGKFEVYGMIYAACAHYFKGVFHKEAAPFKGVNCGTDQAGVSALEIGDSGGAGRKCIADINAHEKSTKVLCAESDAQKNHCIKLSSVIPPLEIDPLAHEVKLMVNDPGKDRGSLACHSFTPPLYTRMKYANDEEEARRAAKRAQVERHLRQIKNCRKTLNQLTIAENALKNLLNISPEFGGFSNNDPKYTEARKELSTRRAELEKLKAEEDRKAEEKAEAARVQKEKEDALVELEKEKKQQKDKEDEFKDLLRSTEKVALEDLENLREQLVTWSHENPQDRSKIVQALYRIIQRYSREMPKHKRGEDDEDETDDQVDTKLAHLEKARDTLDKAVSIAESMKDDEDSKTKKAGRKYLSDLKNTDRSLHTLRIKTLALRGSRDSEFRSEYRKLFQSAIRGQMQACSMITGLDAYERCAIAQQRMMNLNEIPYISQQADFMNYNSRMQNMMWHMGGMGYGGMGYGGYPGMMQNFWGGGYPFGGYSGFGGFGGMGSRWGSLW